MSEPKRLHPISALANFVKQLKELLIPILLFVVVGNSEGYIQFFITLGFVLLILITGILTWLRFTYRIEEGELRIESGIIVRKKRYIPFERIQSLDLSEGILQRPFGLVKMTVETAGSGTEAEAVLTAITKSDADRIQQALSYSKSENQLDMESQVTKEESIIYKIKPSELLLLSSTSGGVGVVISAVVAFMFQFAEVIPYERVYEELEVFISSSLIFISILVFLGFLVAWLIALIGSVLKYANFTVKRTDEDIIISRGLLEKRQLTIPLHRIQALRISENIIRQPLGLASVFVESAGGSVKDSDNARVMLLPVIKKSQIEMIMASCLPDYDLNHSFTPAPKRALRRYMYRGLILSVPISAALIYFFRPWGYIGFAVIFISLFFSYLQFRAAGWNLEESQATLRYRGITKNTVFLKKNRTQSLTMSESHFQKKRKLATIQAMAMSGSGATGGKVADLEQDDVITLYKWYSYTDCDQQEKPLH
ncbi:PH domain-containing protein [Cytobacillus purgationiresistens]|uniref:Membrane protein n=1 Tax=Cytobacillus purgationiresistens TaxID=863449 RepID=A0ABU0AS09_9BACI|nr:PH domain-containing protein [Cytobacillus purgationiresistens]MDQ0273213.1 putative membrane protein [Cytobacillus purgationiresistens]